MDKLLYNEMITRDMMFEVTNEEGGMCLCGVLMD